MKFKLSVHSGQYGQLCTKLRIWTLEDDKDFRYIIKYFKEAWRLILLINSAPKMIFPC